MPCKRVSMAIPIGPPGSHADHRAAVRWLTRIVPSGSRAQGGLQCIAWLLHKRAKTVDRLAGGSKKVCSNNHNSSRKCVPPCYRTTLFSR